MAKKKYKSFKIEQEELKPMTIGAFESRKRTSIGIFIILTIFVIVVIFLPEISDVVNEYLNPTPTTPVTPNTPQTPEEPDEPETPSENIDETFYAYTPDLTIVRDEINVANIIVDTLNNTISYSITNKLNTYQNISDLNYYLEIYNSERTLLERVKIISDSLLEGGSTRTYHRNITATSATTIGYLVLVKKTTDDYPEVTLNADANGNASMVCTNAHETVTYEFNNNELKRLTSTVEYLSTVEDYETIYSQYQTLANSYNGSSGITSTFFNSMTGFNITTIVNLEEASRSYIFNADSFSLNTEPKVVSFEMEAQGFKCN